MQLNDSLQASSALPAETEPWAIVGMGTTIDLNLMAKKKFLTLVPSLTYFTSVAYV
jgi:hypothetical protein